MADGHSSNHSALPEYATLTAAALRPQYFGIDFGDPDENDDGEDEDDDDDDDGDDEQRLTAQNPRVAENDMMAPLLSHEIDVEEDTDSDHDSELLQREYVLIAPPTPFNPPRGYPLVGEEPLDASNTSSLIATILKTGKTQIVTLRSWNNSGEKEPEQEKEKEKDSNDETTRPRPARLTDNITAWSNITAWPNITAAHARQQFYIDLRSLDPRVHKNDGLYLDDPILRLAHQKIADFTTINKQFHNKHPAFAYVTIITNASYLPGVITLLYSIRKSGGTFPLVVLYTKNLSATAIAALEFEMDDPDNLLEIYCIEPLLPPGHHTINVAHPRFADTWTKLRVFQLYTRFTTVVYLDADMVVTENDNIDYIFEYARWLPKNTIAAVHDCVCSQPSYGKEQCVFTGQSSPVADYYHITARQGDTGPTTLFNSGMFLFHPTEKLWKAMLYYFENSTKLGEFRFPDQDFLVTFFKYRWTGLPWQWNAVKTMAYRHSGVFKMDRANIVHFIVDKPWAKRPSEEEEGEGEEKAVGQDGPLHQYWWRIYGQWRKEKEEEGRWGLLSIVGKHVGDVAGRRRIDNDLAYLTEEAPPYEKYILVDLEKLPPFRGYDRAVKTPRKGLGVVVSWAEDDEIEEEDEEALRLQ